MYSGNRESRCKGPVTRKRPQCSGTRQEAAGAGMEGKGRRLWAMGRGENHVVHTLTLLFFTLITLKTRFSLFLCIPVLGNLVFMGSRESLPF